MPFFPVTRQIFVIWYLLKVKKSIKSRASPVPDRRICIGVSDDEGKEVSPYFANCRRQIFASNHDVKSYVIKKRKK